MHAKSQNVCRGWLSHVFWFKWEWCFETLLVGFVGASLGGSSTPIARKGSRRDIWRQTDGSGLLSLLINANELNWTRVC